MSTSNSSTPATLYTSFAGGRPRSSSMTAPYPQELDMSEASATTSTSQGTSANGGSVRPLMSYSASTSFTTNWQRDYTSSDQTSGQRSGATWSTKVHPRSNP
ncbi:hypothetical protein F5Y16DRAFT_214180 [Xylariaceae sp. FL0255]|nr:hypothetical protein F5Y16DRAFT_214180 [Xylariaceae sp. FL0255]